MSQSCSSSTCERAMRLPNCQPPLGGHGRLCRADVEQRVDAGHGFKRDRRYLVGRNLPLRTLPAMSANSKNLRRAWLQHSALITGAGPRPGTIEIVS